MDVIQECFSVTVTVTSQVYLIEQIIGRRVTSTYLLVAFIRTKGKTAPKKGISIFHNSQV